MPFTKIDDILEFDDEVIRATGTLVRPQDLNLDPELHPTLNPDLTIALELMKTFWVRVCQAEHVHGGETEMITNVAEGSAFDESFLNGDGTWSLELQILEGSVFQEGAAAASAVLVYEAEEDLFSLAWSECAHLKRAP